MVVSISSSSNPLFFASTTSGTSKDVHPRVSEKYVRTVSGRAERTSFEDVRIRQVLFRRHLGPFPVSQPHWGLVGLKPRDRSRLSCLTNDIDGLTDTNRCRQKFARLVERDEEALRGFYQKLSALVSGRNGGSRTCTNRVHSHREEVQHPVRLVEDEPANVGEGHESREETTHGDRRHE